MIGAVLSDQFYKFLQPINPHVAVFMRCSDMQREKEHQSGVTPPLRVCWGVIRTATTQRPNESPHWESLDKAHQKWELPKMKGVEVASFYFYFYYYQCTINLHIETLMPGQKTGSTLQLRSLGLWRQLLFYFIFCFG